MNSTALLVFQDMGNAEPQEIADWIAANDARYQFFVEHFAEISLCWKPAERAAFIKSLLQYGETK